MSSKVARSACVRNRALGWVVSPRDDVVAFGLVDGERENVPVVELYLLDVVRCAAVGPAPNLPDGDDACPDYAARVHALFLMRTLTSLMIALISCGSFSTSRTVLGRNLLP